MPSTSHDRCQALPLCLYDPGLVHEQPCGDKEDSGVEPGSEALFLVQIEEGELPVMETEPLLQSQSRVEVRLHGEHVPFAEKLNQRVNDEGMVREKAQDQRRSAVEGGWPRRPRVQGAGRRSIRRLRAEGLRGSHRGNAQGGAVRRGWPEATVLEPQDEERAGPAAAARAERGEGRGHDFPEASAHDERFAAVRLRTSAAKRFKRVESATAL